MGAVQPDRVRFTRATPLVPVAVVTVAKRPSYSFLIDKQKCASLALTMHYHSSQAIVPFARDLLVEPLSLNPGNGSVGRPGLNRVKTTTTEREDSNLVII